jgi:quercetin dioxygenase-like cupin family protein
MINKTKSCVVSAEEGDAFWQPGVKGNFITIKVSPWNVEKTSHTVFLHELPKGGEVPEHAHQENEEIFICLEGEGVINIDGKTFSFKKHDVAFLAPLSTHHIQNTGETPLKFMVVISPTGLEERLRLMGVPKVSVDEVAPENVELDIGKQSTHGVIKKSR